VAGWRAGAPRGESGHRPPPPPARRHARGDRRREPRCLAGHRVAAAQTAPKKAEDSISAEQKRPAADGEAAARGKAEGGGGARARDLGAGRAGGDRAAAGGQAARGRPARHPDQARGGRREVAPRRDPAARETHRSGQQAALARACAPCTRSMCRGRAADVVVGRGSGDAGGGRPAPHQPRLSDAASFKSIVVRQTAWRIAAAGREPAEGLGDIRTDAQREQSEVDRDAAKRRVLLAKVRDERAYHERMVGELTEAARRLEAFIRDLQAKQRRVAKIRRRSRAPKPFRPWFRHASGPAAVATEGRVVSAFGAQVHPRFGTRRSATASTSRPAKAATWPPCSRDTSCTRVVQGVREPDHPGPRQRVLHAVRARRDIVVKEGDDVRQGQRIGTVGDTGSLEGRASISRCVTRASRRTRTMAR